MKKSLFLFKCDLGTHKKNGGEATGPFPLYSYVWENIAMQWSLGWGWSGVEDLENPFSHPDGTVENFPWSQYFHKKPL